MREKTQRGTENRRGEKVQKEAGMHTEYEIFPGVVTLYYYPLSHLPAPLCARGALAQYQRAFVPPLSLIVVAARAQHISASLFRYRGSLQSRSTCSPELISGQAN